MKIHCKETVILRQLMALLAMLSAAFSLAAVEITLEYIQGLPVVIERQITVDEIELDGSLILAKGKFVGKKGQRPISFAVTEDLKHIFFGRLLDAKTGDRIHIKKSPDPYKKDAHFVFGHGPEEFFIFTDPTCPFCLKFEKQLMENDESLTSRIKIHYFLYPIVNVKKSEIMSRFILANNNNNERLKLMREIMLKGSLDYANSEQSIESVSSSNAMLESAKNIGQDLGIVGTPVIINSTGQQFTSKRFFETLDGN